MEEELQYHRHQQAPPATLYKSLVCSIHVYTPVADAQVNNDSDNNHINDSSSSLTLAPVRVSRSSGEYFLERCDLVRGKNGNVVSLNNVYEQRCREEFSGRRIRGRRATNSKHYYCDTDADANYDDGGHNDQRRVHYDDDDDCDHRRPNDADDDNDNLTLRESSISLYSENHGINSNRSSRRSYPDAYLQRNSSQNTNMSTSTRSGEKGVKKLTKNLRDAARKLVSKKSKHRDDENGYGY